MAIPITYLADRGRAEAILLEAARAYATEDAGLAAEKKAELKERFGVDPVELEPRVCYRLTDNWLGLTVRMLVGTHRIRSVKDAMSRQIITELDHAGIGIASATYDIVGFPPLEVRQLRAPPAATAS